MPARAEETRSGPPGKCGALFWALSLQAGKSGERQGRFRFGRERRYKDMTVKHRVNEKKGEYRFELDLGGVLDAE